MKNIPYIYKNTEKKNIKNNREIFYNIDKTNQKLIFNNKKNLINKVEKIINSPSFIYCEKVTIVMKNETIYKKIIGIKNNNLITIDNEMIPIQEIDDILIT